MELSTEAAAYPDKNEELYYILLSAVLDGTAYHIMAGCGKKSGHEAMEAMKKWYNGSDTQQNTNDMYHDKLKTNLLDKSSTAQLYINTFMEYTMSLETLGEKIPERTLRNIFLNNIVDPDYENIHTILKSTKRSAPLPECMQDIREWEDDLERHSNGVRKSEKVRRVIARSNDGMDGNVAKLRPKKKQRI